MENGKQAGQGDHAWCTQLDGAIARGVSFIEYEQLPNGGFVEEICTNGTLFRRQQTVFTAALLAHALANTPEAASVTHKCLDFLAAEVEPFGLWKFPARADFCHSFFPPDIDDTVCATRALRDAGRPARENASLLMANRAPNGLYYTWFTWRFRWVGIAHLRTVLPQILYLRHLLPLFFNTCASPINIDAVVNANVLYCLGERSETRAIIPYLMQVLTENHEETCDIWYFNQFVIWHFFARALLPYHDEARDVIIGKLRAAIPKTPLESALKLLTGLRCGIPADASSVSDILDHQSANGEWSREQTYRGEHHYWGSAAQTTGFIIEALSEYRTTLRAS